MHHITRRQFIKWVGVTSCAFASSPFLNNVYAEEPPKILSFYNTHTGEFLKNITFFEKKWVDDGLQAIHHLFRDHRTGDIHPIDTDLLLLLHDVRDVMGVDASHPFHLISGYRSPQTNAMLRAKKGPSIAKKSQHMLGKAADIALPKARSIADIKKAAISLKRGGVGAYSHFVHVDTGRVRQW